MRIAKAETRGRTGVVPDLNFQLSEKPPGEILRTIFRSLYRHFRPPERLKLVLKKKPLLLDGLPVEAYVDPTTWTVYVDARDPTKAIMALGHEFVHLEVARPLFPVVESYNSFLGHLSSIEAQSNIESLISKVTTEGQLALERNYTTAERVVNMFTEKMGFYPNLLEGWRSQKEYERYLKATEGPGYDVKGEMIDRAEISSSYGERDEEWAGFED